MWEWLLVTSVTVWPVRTDRSDYESTAARLFLEKRRDFYFLKLLMLI